LEINTQSACAYKRKGEDKGMKKVGFLAIEEEPFISDIFENIWKMSGGKISVEMCRVSELELNMDVPYDLIIDRLSHCIPYYLQYSRTAYLKGTYVINNPFRFYVDKFFGYLAAKELGVPVPKTVLLPPKLFPRSFKNRDLKNMVYPIAWGEIIDYIGFPAYFKPAGGWGWRDVFKVEDFDELMYLYDRTGYDLMLLQENIEYDHYVRCFCLGRKHVMPIKYVPDAPHHQQYVVEHSHLTPTQGKLISQYACALSDVLDFDMNVCEFAIHKGVPVAIDFTNMVPDVNPHSIRWHYYDWLIETLTGVIIDYTENPRLPGIWKSAEKIFGKYYDFSSENSHQRYFV
jgi:glutathione synthase/RimK-type ligase-like ATP-grasp enzyme